MKSRFHAMRIPVTPEAMSPLLPRSVIRRIKRLLPTSLFGRAFLILVLPVIIVQIITAHIFFDRHWASVTRHLSESLAGEVAWLVEGWDNAPDNLARRRILAQTTRFMGFAVYLEPSLKLSDWASEEVHFPMFERKLRDRIEQPFTMRFLPEHDVLQLLILAEGGMLRVEIPKKRLASSTTLIFLGWMIGASVLFLLIAVVFLRNQIRPIVRLAEAAERFGKGQYMAGFHPSGAREVRQAAKAFIDMRERITRQVESRTAMLSGISHDLRTPLTRMKLQLAMLPEDTGRDELQQDIADMEHMVEEYLAFAKGEGGEAATTIRLDIFMHEVMEPYQRENKPVQLGEVPERSATMKTKAMQRVIRNLMENALRYGDECLVTVKAMRRRVEFIVDDNGPGIAPEDRDAVFQAFRRLEGSRNTQTGGAGLGLTIVRDIVHAHGGDVLLDDSPKGGLRAIVRLPL